MLQDPVIPMFAAAALKGGFLGLAYKVFMPFEQVLERTVKWYRQEAFAKQ